MTAHILQWRGANDVAGRGFRAADQPAGGTVNEQRARGSLQAVF